MLDEVDRSVGEEAINKGVLVEGNMVEPKVVGFVIDG